MVKMIDCAKTENYLSEKQRMTKGCDIKCIDCPLSYQNNGTPERIGCKALELNHPETAISIIQRWSDEHSQRTYLSEFLKNYPKAQLRTVLLYSQLEAVEAGIISPEIPKCICPYHLGLMSSDDCRKGHNCVKCWNQPIEDGEER